MEELAPIIGFGILILLGIIPLALWLWSLIHCVTNRQLSDTNRLIGVLLIVFLFLIGSFVYLFLPRETPDPSQQRHV